MGTTELVKEINRLPIVRRKLIVEKVLQTINESETKKKMQTAVDLLMKDYVTDRELTAFTSLDFSNFYEAR